MTESHVVLLGGFVVVVQQVGYVLGGCPPGQFIMGFLLLSQQVLVGQVGVDGAQQVGYANSVSPVEQDVIWLLLLSQQVLVGQVVDVTGVVTGGTIPVLGLDKARVVGQYLVILRQTVAAPPFMGMVTASPY